MNTARTLLATAALVLSAAAAFAQEVAFTQVLAAAEAVHVSAAQRISRTSVTPAAAAAPAATVLLPTYAGGAEALAAAIAERLEYPAVAQANGIEGTVVLRLRVDEAGGVTVSQVIESLTPSCDAAAVAAVESLDAFTPARLNGQAFARNVRVAVRFAL